MTDVPPPPPPTVAVAMLRLSPLAQWRYVLRRRHPRSRDPIMTGLIQTVLLMGYLGFVGAFVAMLGQMIQSPWVLAGVGMVAALLWPLRLWVVKRASVALWRRAGTFEMELGAAGVTIRSPNRVTTVDWAGVADFMLTRREVVFRFHAGDLIAVPTSVFADDAALGRFVTLARSSVAAAAEGRDHGWAP